MIAMGAQYVVLGTGERRYHDLLAALARQFPKSFSCRIAFDNGLAHLMEAGADIFLMPSRYEPCGLNQLYSLKYGTVPVVRAVGGLDDTIIDYDAATDSGTGFKFEEYSVEAFLEAVGRALAAYKDGARWKALMRRCMADDFSWEHSARQYIHLYEKALRKHERR
jgi:starch synthase